MFSEGSRSNSKQSDDEDDFFTASSKSRLAKIFGIGAKSASNNNERSNAPVAPKPIKVSERYGPSNFRYVPSQPDTAPEEIGKGPEWTMVRATVVTAYKLIDGDNVFLGKVGLAMLKSTSGHSLLLYRAKTEVLGTVTFSPGIKLFLKQDYLQFCTDDSNDFWSVLFESESDRQAMLAVLETWCTIEREPIVEEPMSEAEKDPEPINKRSSLVARMARMGGQAMPLPERMKAPPIPAAGPGSDSSDTSDSKIETISTRPVRRQNMMPAIGMQMVPMAGMVASANAQNTALCPGQGSTTMADVNFNLVMSETRMQNTEMRMNITKLESKLDRVLDRIDLLNLQGTPERPANVADKEAEILALEEKLLELKRENHSLKTKLRSLEATELEGKRNADAQLEQQIQTMEATERRLKADVVNSELMVEAARAECERQKDKMVLAERQLAEAKENTLRNTKELESTLLQLKEVRADRDQLKHQLEIETRQSVDAKEQINVLQQENNLLSHQIATSNDSLLKDVMNNIYRQLCEEITDSQMLRLIAQKMKLETIAALDREKIKFDKENT